MVVVVIMVMAVVIMIMVVVVVVMKIMVAVVMKIMVVEMLQVIEFISPSKYGNHHISRKNSEVNMSFLALQNDKFLIQK